MDLLQSVRKSGSRGGVNFSWDEVKNSAHRENYLGHSLKAPVGRWQSKKDLGWYAKGDDAELTPEEKAAQEAEARKEELRKVKEAEHDAMLKAMGLPVPDRENANLQPLGLGKAEQAGVNRALKEALGDDVEEDGKAVAKVEPERRDRRRVDNDEKDASKRRDHEIVSISIATTAIETKGRDPGTGSSTDHEAETGSDEIMMTIANLRGETATTKMRSLESEIEMRGGGGMIVWTARGRDRLIGVDGEVSDELSALYYLDFIQAFTFQLQSNIPRTEPRYPSRRNGTRVYQRSLLDYAKRIHTERNDTRNVLARGE
ncbi:hypothetical protein LTR17_022273 [Elasticomyces elasticus]|nr:hypothetical protein LTR17_022273 [Elasticomyces elasticus]